MSRLIDMPNSTFYREKIHQLKNAIDQALAAGASPVAAFDADGTLWDTDLGEAFFKYQIQKRLLPTLSDQSWSEYKLMHDLDAQKSFLWLAQINAGREVSEVRRWAEAAVESFSPLPIFNHMQEIIQFLHQRNVNVYIVTASIKWAVEPGAKHFGIPAENVLGVKTAVKNGVITDEQDGVITWHEGKVTALLEATKDIAPMFSAGNTVGDLALLKAATHARLVNVAAPKDDRNYESEQKLLKIAHQHGWFFYDKATD